jgi:hypothetical protein
MDPERPAAFVHPLARSDAHLAQDFLLTKITLLCAAGAGPDEWVFELAAMDEVSAPADRAGNAFLFALTLLRYLHALTRAVPPEDPVRLPAFPAGFAEAVVAGDGAAAEELWSRGAPDVPTSLTAPRMRDVTMQALAVIDAVPRPHPVALTAYLPRPYEAGGV